MRILKLQILFIAQPYVEQIISLVDSKNLKNFFHKPQQKLG
jgi:hypothetical protein